MRQPPRTRNERYDAAAAPATSKVQLLAPQEYTSYVHEVHFHESDLVVNPNLLPSIRDGDLLEIYLKGEPPERRVVLKATLVDSTRHVNFHFSVAKSVTDAFAQSGCSIIPREACMMSQVLAKDRELDYVELTIKDQFVPRADLYRFLRAVNGSTAHGGKTFELQGVRARMVTGIRNKQPVYSGVITSRTHVNLRSRSSRIFWLVQLSIEMYDYAPDGNLYMEVFFDFVRTVLQRWRDLEVTHHLTVVYFSRTFFHTKKESPAPLKDGLYQRPVLTALDGRLYEDVYKVVVHNETIPYDGGDALLTRLEREMLNFPVTMGWCKTININEPTVPDDGGGDSDSDGDGDADEPFLGSDDPSEGIAIPSYASQGNFLEALNVTLNVLEKHYLDRDLTRSGNSIVTISAGTGVFEVDARLSDITLQRMMDNGIGMDMVSLSQPPLHTAPLFILKNPVDSSTPKQDTGQVAGDMSRKKLEVTGGSDFQAAGEESGARPGPARGDATHAISPAPVPASAVAAAQAAGDVAKRIPIGVDGDSKALAAAQAAQQAAVMAAAVDRRTSTGSEAYPKHDKPHYEVPHWMNLSFARAPNGISPGKQGDAMFGAPVASSCGGRAVTAEDNDTGYGELPLPKLLEPPVMRFNKEGKLRLSLPPVLSMLLGFKRRETTSSSAVRVTERSKVAVEETPSEAPTGSISESSEANASRQAPLSNADTRRPTEKAHAWGNVEKVWPQPIPGVEGAVAAAVQLDGSDSTFPLPLIHGAQIYRTASLPSASSLTGTPPAASGWQRSCSPTITSASEATGPAASNASRFPDLMGTSPGSGYVGSPGSLGIASLTLEHLTRPFPDRDRNRTAPQATLRRSPRGSGSAGGATGIWGASNTADGSREAPLSDSSDGTIGAGDDKGRGENRTDARLKELFLRYHEKVFQPKSVEQPTKQKRAQSAIPGAGSGDPRGPSFPIKSKDDADQRRGGRTPSSGGSTTSHSRSDPRLQELFPMSSKSRVSPSDGKQSDGWTRSPSTWRRTNQTVGEVGVDSDGGSATGSPMPESQFDQRLGADEVESRGRDQQPRSPNLIAKAYGYQLFSGGQSPGASRPGRGIAARSQRDASRLSLSPNVVRGGVPHVHGQNHRLAWGGPPLARMSAEMQQKRSLGAARGPTGLAGSSNSSGRGVIPTNSTARMPSGMPSPNFRATLPVQIGSAGGRPGRNRGPSLTLSQARQLGSRSTATTPPQDLPQKLAPVRRATTAGDLSGVSPGKDGREGGHGRGRLGISGGAGVSSSLETHVILKKPPFSGPQTAGESPGSGSASGVSVPQGSPADSGINSPLSTSNGFTGDSEFNPFKKRDEKELLQIRTHNRRRWSHVIPPGQKEFRRIPGPFWRSLCQPALLPLSTDFVPSPREITKHYAETNYSLVLQHNDSMLFRDVRPLLEEMCCQRLAQDFQLVERASTEANEAERSKISSRGARVVKHAQSYDFLARTAQEISGADNPHLHAGAGRTVPVLDGRIVYVLSMGHRLQTLTYTEESNTVSVRRYVQKEGVNIPTNRYEYRYSLWLPQMGHVQTIQQTFLKFPSPEYNFNYVDSLLSGFATELNEFTKFRRLLFTIIPPEIKCPGDEDAYVTALRGLAEHLNSKKQEKSPDDMDRPQDPIQFEFTTCFGGKEARHPDAPSVNFDRKTVRMDVTSGANDGALKREKPRSEWLDVMYDKVVDVKGTTQLDVRWLVCSGATVAEYVKVLHRRAADLNIRLVQVPEYATGEKINLHPLITHPYIQLPELAEADEVAIVDSVKQDLRTKLGFVRCRDVRTAWKAFGLKFLKPGGLGSSLSARGIGGALDPLGRVYCHRTGAAFVRVAPRGFVFLENLHWRDTSHGQYQPSEQRSSRPGKVLPQQLLNDLRRLVEVTYFVHGLAKSVAEKAVDQAVEETARGSPSPSSS